MTTLLLISNLTHEDRGEDLLLADRLGSEFDVTIASPKTAVPLLAAKAVDACLIRNAWPSRQFRYEFAVIEQLVAMHALPCYNPFIKGRRGPVEDKRYLAELYEEGYPVIPTYLSPTDMSNAGFLAEDEVIVKPVDGCSSSGITATLLAAAKALPSTIYQPKISFAFEVSFYFIDNHFGWAMRSAGGNIEDRWTLARYAPSPAEIAWAERFVKWNGLPYGIQRIDAARMPDGALLLMEVEDSMPLLSLDALGTHSRDAVLASIVESVTQNLEPLRFIAERRRATPIEKMVALIQA